MDTNGYISTYSGGGSIQDLDKLRNNTEAILRVSKLYLKILTLVSLYLLAYLPLAGQDRGTEKSVVNELLNHFLFDPITKAIFFSCY